MIAGLESNGYAAHDLYENKTVSFSHSSGAIDVYYYAYSDIDSGEPQLGEIHVDTESGQVFFADYPPYPIE
jgi:hypothetical protein